MFHFSRVNILRRLRHSKLDGKLFREFHKMIGFERKVLTIKVQMEMSFWWQSAIHQPKDLWQKLYCQNGLLNLFHNSLNAKKYIFHKTQMLTLAVAVLTRVSSLNDETKSSLLSNWITENFNERSFDIYDVWSLQSGIDSVSNQRN